MRYIIALSSLLLLQPLSANPLFKGFTAEYDVSKNDIYLGISKRRLVMREQGKTLDYVATTIPKGLVALFVSDRFMEHSLIKIRHSHLQPVRYEYQRSGGKKDVTFQARFDWQKKLITMSNHPEPIPMPTNPNDLLSFQLALMDGLYRGVRDFEFNIVDHKQVRLHKLEYTLTVKMPSSLGELDVLKLDEAPSDRGSRFSFWCARQLYYLPILVRQTRKNGDITELKLRLFNNKEFTMPDEEQAEEEF